MKMGGFSSGTKRRNRDGIKQDAVTVAQAESEKQESPEE